MKAPEAAMKPGSQQPASPPKEPGTQKTETDANRYPAMRDKERVVKHRYPTGADKTAHERIKGYFAAKRDKWISIFVELGADQIRYELDTYGKLVSKEAKAMDRAIRKYSKFGDKDRIVWRGLETEGTIFEKLKVGDIIDIISPTSTSTSLGIAQRFAEGQTMLRVHLPKGVKRLVTNPGELEMVIPGGYRFRVVRVYKGPKEMTLDGQNRWIEQWVDVVVEKTLKKA